MFIADEVSPSSAFIKLLKAAQKLQKNNKEAVLALDHILLAMVRLNLHALKMAMMT